MPFISRRLRKPVGIALAGAAFAAAWLVRGGSLWWVSILAVIAALSGWWPAPASSNAVAVTAVSGQAWCGPLVTGPAAAISVRTGNGVVTVPVQAIARVRPVAQCR